MIKITLSFPHRNLNPNVAKGRHWSTVSTLKSAARKEGYFLALEKKHAFYEHSIPLAITFCMSDRRKRDADNLLASIKSALDGVADGLGVNDSQFEPVTIRRVYGAEKACVILEIG